MRKSKPKALLALLLLAAAALPTAAAQGATLSAPGGGVVRALTMGIDVYPKLGAGLKGAVADAEDIHHALEADGVKDLTALYNQQVTRARVIAEMDRLVSTSRPGDLVIVSYAGHGRQVREYTNWQTIEPHGVNEVIALSGYNFTGPDANEVIVNEEVRAWLYRLNAKSVDVLVVWDSCFGGGMRSITPDGVQIRVRTLYPPSGTRASGYSDQEPRRRFPSIAMTDKEARADVKTMEHVTFLAGADASSEVPEMTGVDPAHPTLLRGALSYYLARALEGQADHGAVPRHDLYGFLKQHVREATQELQSLQVDPQSPDAAVADKAVFIVADAAPAPAPPPKDAVGVYIKDGPASAFASVEKGSTPVFLATDPNVAELVWNVEKREAIEKGAVIMENVDGSMIGAIADRVRALSRLRAAGASRPLPFTLESGVASLSPGEVGHVGIDDLQGQHLVVFNIAADATVQMIYPAAPSERGHCDDPSGDHWTCELKIVEPFGVDTLVGITTSQDPATLLDWLRGHHGHRDAAGVPELFESLAAADSQARVGFVGVVTAAAK